jgi:hypothetical protein
VICGPLASGAFDDGGDDDGLHSVGQSHTTTGAQALLASRLRVANGALDAVLALLEFNLGRRP